MARSFTYVRILANGDSLCTPTVNLEFSNRIQGEKRIIRLSGRFGTGQCIVGSCTTRLPRQNCRFAPRFALFLSHPLLQQPLRAVCLDPCQGTILVRSSPCCSKSPLHLKERKKIIRQCQSDQRDDCRAIGCPELLKRYLA